jgi:hypothetical protein
MFAFIAPCPLCPYGLESRSICTCSGLGIDGRTNAALKSPKEEGKKKSYELNSIEYRADALSWCHAVSDRQNRAGESLSFAVIRLESQKESILSEEEGRFIYYKRQVRDY